MIDYTAIVLAIPATELNAALAVLAIEHPKTRSDGSPVLVGGVQETSSGKFMELSTVEAAFDAIKDLTVVSVRDSGRQTYASLAGTLGLALTSQLEAAMGLAATAMVIGPWVDKALNNDGIDSSDPQVIGLLTSLIDQFGIDQELVDAIASLSSETVPMFPGLKLGHVQNALQKHALGV